MRCLLTIAFVAVCLGGAEAGKDNPEPLCKPGRTWIKDTFKIECYKAGNVIGYKPVACVPSGEQGAEEYMPGEAWVQNNFKIECQETNNGLTTAIVACVPSGELGDEEYQPGDSWAENGFKIECQQTKNGLKTAVVSCLVPGSNSEIPVGRNVGKYRCIRRGDGSVVRQVIA